MIYVLYDKCMIEGRFTLWPKVERPSIFTNQIARNHGFGLSTLHSRGQSPTAVTLQNAYVAVLFDQGDGLLKGSLGRMGMETQTVVERPSIPSHKIMNTIFYYLFSVNFFELSTKFGLSIPWPLDLNGHSVKRPL